MSIGPLPFGTVDLIHIPFEEVRVIFTVTVSRAYLGTRHVPALALIYKISPYLYRLYHFISGAWYSSTLDFMLGLCSYLTNIKTPGNRAPYH